MTSLFEPGSTAVRRNVYRGRVWSAWPCRVVQDGGDELALAVWTGVELLNQLTSIEALGSKEKSLRFSSLSNVATGEPELGTDVLGGSTILAFHRPDEFFSVLQFFGASGEFRHWYVNFERPFVRTAIGIDTFDLMLDLIVEPDGTYRWKDEDEYAHGRGLGLVTDADHVAVGRAREVAFAMIDARQGPFDERWLRWRPEPDWSIPTLAANARSARVT